MSIIAEAAATQIPSGTWSIDPVWSSLEFEVKKVGLIPIKGRVPGFTGTIEGGGEPAIEGTVDATSITTFDETRDGHLQSPDFFDTARYPEVRFASTEVSFDEGEVRVQGNLTIKGTTKPVELEGHPSRLRPRHGWERASRRRAGRQARPDRLRARLERSASGGRVPPSERGHGSRDVRSGAGGLR